MWIAGFSLFLLGPMFVISSLLGRKKNNRCSAQTEGILKDIRQRYNSDGSLPDMYVYSYCVDGIEYQTKSTIRGSQAKNIGDICTIWYNPRKPRDAQPFHHDSLKIYSVFYIVGIIMTLLGILLLIIALSQ